MTRWPLLLLFTAACGGGSDLAPGTYVDRMPSVDPWLAVTVDGNGAAAFVCGGSATLASDTRWMTTTADGNGLHFAKDGWLLDLDATQDGLTGRLTQPDGMALSVAALRPADPLAGLYTAVDSGCRAGVIIVSGDASKGAWCDDLGHFSQVTPLSPIEQTAQGIAVTATDAPGGPKSFFVEPAVVSDVSAGP